jgi:hypothetical protein
MTADQRRPDWPGVLLAAALWAGIISLLVFMVAYLYSPDVYYHVRLAAIMARDGLRLESFPYVTESIWRDRFFDKDWLFHVLLIPFTRWHEIRGPQLLIVLLNLGILGAFWAACRSLGYRHPAWLLLLLPFCGHAAFLHRLSDCRPHLLSLLLLAAGIAACAARRPLLLALVAGLYALSYTGHWQLLGVVLIYDVLYAFLDDQGRRRPHWLRTCPMLVAAALGMLLGELCHPQFPHNLYGLVVQNLLVLASYWQGAAAAGSDIIAQVRPAEIRAYPWRAFLLDHAPVLIGLAGIALHAWHHRLRPSRHLLWLAALSLIYLVITTRSMRFTEYLTPIGALTIAVYIRQVGWTELLPRRAIRAALGLALAAFALDGLRHAVGNNLRQRVYMHNTPVYQEPGRWIARHLQPGAVVFATSWSDSAFLWFHAPDQRYLVFLDPYFMYQRDPERFLLWHYLRLGRVENPAQVITEQFGAYVVFSQQHDMVDPLLRQLAATPGVTRIDHGGRSDDVLFLLPGAPLRQPLPPPPQP